MGIVVGEVVGFGGGGTTGLDVLVDLPKDLFGIELCGDGDCLWGFAGLLGGELSGIELRGVGIGAGVVGLMVPNG